MARKVRLEYEGAIYHVMNRGDRREDIFIDDKDREWFLDTLGEACLKTDWQVHAYCLMCNHFHLVLETPKPNLSVGMKWFLGTYTTRYNRRHKQYGHLFSGRFKAPIVDGSGDGYFKTVCDYVHLNPLRAGLLGPEQRLSEYRWSSYPEYLKPPGSRWQRLRVDRLLGEWRIGTDTVAGRRDFERQMERRKRQEQMKSSEGEELDLAEEWCWGSEAFRQGMLAMIEQRQTDQHYGKELREAAEQKARRLMGEMLSEAGWTEDVLRRERKSAAVKLDVAARLRAETTMDWKWIAQNLHMGHWRSAANAVRLARQ